MRGFTLLELLVSLSMVTIMMVSLYGAFHFHMDTMQRLGYQAEALRKARGILELMCRDISSLYPLGGPGIEREHDTIDGRPADRLQLITLAGRGFRRGGPYTDILKVSYFGKEDAQGRGFTLYRREAGAAGVGNFFGRQTREVARDVSALTITFADGGGHGFDKWSSMDDGKGWGVPPMVMIRVSVTDASGTEHRLATSIHPPQYGQGEP